MFSAVRRRLTWANIAMTLALVFAMSGGAFAAKRYLITSTKQISPAVLKKLKGARGPAGVAGATGPAGTTGPQGPAGANGKDGINGVNGVNGVSVASKESKTGKLGPCKEGGSEFQSASGTTFACNGERGREGTFGGQTLPAGQTLKGYWAGTGFGEAEFPEPGFGLAQAVVSYALPLTSPPQTHYIREGEPLPEGCAGTLEDPEAEPGNLCLFVETEINSGTGRGAPKFADDGVDGFILTASTHLKGAVVFNGTWAVTEE